MLITEKKLREIIRNVIEESWRDSLPIVGIPKMGEEGYRDDLERSTNMAYTRREYEKQSQQDPIHMKSQEDSAYSQKFYVENNIDLSDAYSIANIFMDSKKNKFKISDFAGSSEGTQNFLRNYFNIVDEDQDLILDSELDELIFDSDKLGLSYSEF